MLRRWRLLGIRSRFWSRRDVERLKKKKKNFLVSTCRTCAIPFCPLSSDYEIITDQWPHHCQVCHRQTCFMQEHDLEFKLVAAWVYLARCEQVVLVNSETFLRVPSPYFCCSAAFVIGYLIPSLSTAVFGCTIEKPLKKTMTRIRLRANAHNNNFSVLTLSYVHMCSHLTK